MGGTLKHRVWVKGMDGLRMMSARLDAFDDQRIADPREEAAQLSFGGVSETNDDKRIVGPKLGAPFRLSESWLDLV